MWDERKFSIMMKTSDLLGSRQLEFGVFSAGVAAGAVLALKCFKKNLVDPGPIDQEENLFLSLTIMDTFETWKRAVATREANDLEFVRLRDKAIGQLEKSYERYIKNLGTKEG